MLSGFNTNVRHRGVLFHVQTEDSGRGRPHVITHLFHGGNILASEKRSYEDRLQSGDLATQVKRLMEEQHGAMLAKLRGGGLDEVIRERLGSDAMAPAQADGAQEPVRLDPADAAPPPERPTAPPTPAGAPPAPETEAHRQPPLDEVVLDYLVEAARRRSKR